jgi:tetratricopeptide (TPR) repeat protein
MHRVGSAVVLVLALSCASLSCSQKPPAVSSAEAIRRGDEAFAKEDFKAAIAAYRIAVANEPDNGEFHLKLARAYRRGSLWTNSVREAIVASDLLPNDREAQLLGIEGMNETQRYFDALSRLAPIMQATPDDPRVLVLFGNATAQMRADTFGLFQISEAWRTGANFEAARLKLRQAMTKQEDSTAEAALRRAYLLDPKLYSARMSLLSFLWATNRLDEGAVILKTAADEDPKHAFLSRTLGLYYEQRGQFDEAERYLEIASANKDRDSILTLAEFYRRRNRLEDARATLAPILGDDPDFRATLLIASLDLELGRHGEALERLDTVLAKQPNNAQALRVKSLATLAAGDAQKAVALAQEAVAHDPVSRDARIVLGQTLAASGDLARAFEEYSQAWQTNMRDPAIAKALARVAFSLGRYGIAADLANQSLRLKPGDVDAAVILLQSHIRLREFKAADRALAAFTGNKDSPEILALQGRILAASGKTEPARAVFAKALQHDRDAIEALGGLIDMEIKAGKASHVRRQFDQVLARHPREPAYLSLSAAIASAEKDVARAEKELRTVLEIDGAREDATLMLISLLADQGRLTEARQVAEKSLERMRTSWRVSIKLGEILELQGLSSEAQAQYEKVMSDNQLAGATTDLIEAFNTASARLAALLANQGGNLDQALQLASAAKRYRPDDPFFSDTLGWVYVRKQRAKVGLPHLEAAVMNNPENPVFRYHLGAAYEQMGEFEKARAELTRALAASPNFMGADGARALLKSIGK